MKKSKIVSILCAAVLAISGTFVAIGREYKNSNKTATVEKAPVSDNVIVKETENQNMSLKSTKILPEEYVKYDVTPLAETAMQLTATVLPAGVDNNGVEWTLSWVNPSSTWASGKTVTDYITLTPTSEHSLTATLSCLQAFGEQAKVTVTSVDNDSATATCTVDYVQKVEEVSLNFGTLPIVLDGETPVKFYIGRKTSGPGGTIKADVKTSSAYTIADTFEESVVLGDFTLEINEERVFSTLATEENGFKGNIYGEMLYFDQTYYMDYWLFVRQSGDVNFISMSYAEVIEQLNQITNPNVQTITFTLTGTHNTYTYTSTIVYDGYNYETGITGVNLNPTTLIF